MFLISIPNTTLRPKSGGGESDLLEFMELGGRRRVDLPQAKMPMCLFLPFTGIPSVPGVTEKTHGCVCVVHTSSWKNRKEKSYGFDFLMSCYFISIGNRNANESKFRKMLNSPAWILNRIYSGL